MCVYLMFSTLVGAISYHHAKIAFYFIKCATPVKKLTTICHNRPFCCENPTVAN